jgi:parallel beta-helix repeat protein
VAGVASVVVGVLGVTALAVAVLEATRGGSTGGQGTATARRPVTTDATERLAGANAVRRKVSGRTLRVVQAGAPVPRDGGPAAATFTDLQEALDAARPGDTIQVSGVHTGEFETVRPGRAGAPITVAGLPGATLRGPAIYEGRVLTVGHDWVVVRGLKVTRGDKGIWVQGASNVTLSGNTVRDTGGECVRIKYLARRNEVAGNRIGPCGAVNFDLRASRKNGEGVYVGTAPEQLSRNPTAVSDASNQNWIHDNVITARAECVDLKEGAELNIVERNTCSGGRDPDGSGLESRGNRNVFRYNTVSDVVGKGIRLGGDTRTQGVDNEVVGNTLVRTGGQAVGAMRLPQRRICGNILGSNRAGASNARSVTPAAPCR